RGPAADRAAGRRRRAGDAARGARQSGHEPGRDGRAPAGIFGVADVLRAGRGRDEGVRSVAVGVVSELEGRGGDWTEERGTSDEGRRRLKAPRKRAEERVRPEGEPRCGSW